MSYQLQAVGGVPPYSWSAVDPLPAGLALSASGVLSGTPTSATPGANYTIQVTDATSAIATVEVWISVLDPPDPSPLVELILESDLALRLEVETRWQPGERNATDLSLQVEAVSNLSPASSATALSPIVEIVTILAPGGGSGGGGSGGGGSGGGS